MCQMEKNNGKENQENKEMLEKYLRIRTDKEMRERRKSCGIRPKREEEKKKRKVKMKEKRKRKSNGRIKKKKN